MLRELPALELADLRSDDINLLPAYLHRFDRAQTRRAYKNDLCQFFGADFVNASLVRRVSFLHINEHIAHLEQDNARPSTIKRRVAAIRGFFEWLEAVEVIDKNPAHRKLIRKVRGVATRDKHILFLTREQSDQLLDATSSAGDAAVRDRALIKTLLYCVLRRSEAASMDFEHVRPLGKYWILDLPYTKGGADQYVKIPEIPEDDSRFLIHKDMAQQLASTSSGSCAITNIATSNISPCDDNGTPSDSSDDTFSVDVTVTFNDAPATGTLDLTGEGTASVSVTGLTSPHTFVGVIMDAVVGPINAIATFSDETTCSLTNVNAGTAPASCSCSVIDIVASNISICDDNGTPSIPGDDVFSADITVTFANPPATGNLNLTGDATASVSATGLTTSTSHTFVGLIMPADGTAIALAATFSAIPNCTFGVDSAGTAPDSCSTLGVNDVDKNIISLYPNPATEAINFASITEEYDVTIYNLLGQRVISKTINESNASVNVASLPIGIYLVKINGYNKVFKFVKK